MSYAHPGSIQVAVGRSLAAIDVNLEQEDVPGVVNQIRLLKAKIVPYLLRGSERETLARYDALAAAKPKGEEEVFENAMQRLEVLLGVLNRFNLYGYKDTPFGSAEDLALQEEEEPLEGPEVIVE